MVFYVLLFLGDFFLQLACEVLDEGELGATDAELFGYFNLCNVRRVERINLLDAIAIGFLADGHGLRAASTADTEDKTLENLYAFALFALGVDVLDLLVDADDHSRFNVLDFCLNHRVIYGR